MAHFLLKSFFDHFNFWYTLFSKIMPNVWRTVIHCCIYKVQIFMLISGQKSCFLEPTPSWNSTTEMTLVSKYIISAPPNFIMGGHCTGAPTDTGRAKEGAGCSDLRIPFLHLLYEYWSCAVCFMDSIYIRTVSSYLHFSLVYWIPFWTVFAVI